MEKFAIMFNSWMTIKINAYFKAFSSDTVFGYKFKRKEG